LDCPIGRGIVGQPVRTIDPLANEAVAIEIKATEKNAPVFAKQYSPT